MAYWSLYQRWVHAAMAVPKEISARFTVVRHTPISRMAEMDCPPKHCPWAGIARAMGERDVGGSGPDDMGNQETRTRSADATHGATGRRALSPDPCVQLVPQVS
jgi:hypothetical protein